MIRSRYLFLSSGDRIVKIARPKDHKYKSVPQLANEDVLEVILYYKNKDRKPHQLLMVGFDRFHLNSNGNYEEIEADRKRAFHNFFLLVYLVYSKKKMIDRYLYLLLQ
ncbi:hypothetical protein ABH892_004993 [Paenibacillus sp. RC254]